MKKEHTYNIIETKVWITDLSDGFSRTDTRIHTVTGTERMAFKRFSDVITCRESALAYSLSGDFAKCVRLVDEKSHVVLVSREIGIHDNVYVCDFRIHKI